VQNHGDRPRRNHERIFYVQPQNDGGANLLAVAFIVLMVVVSFPSSHFAISGFK